MRIRNSEKKKIIKMMKDHIKKTMRMKKLMKMMKKMKKIMKKMKKLDSMKMILMMFQIQVA
jgi:hypothetical protein